MDIAERPIKIINGNIIRVKETVRANFSGKRTKPGANKVTRTGAKKKPVTVTRIKPEKMSKKPIGPDKMPLPFLAPIYIQ
jgi:hypothetical protein